MRQTVAIAWLCLVLFAQFPELSESIGSRCAEEVLELINAAYQKYVAGTETFFKVIKPTDLTENELQIDCAGITKNANSFTKVQTKTGIDLQVRGTFNGACSRSEKTYAFNNKYVVSRMQELSFTKRKDNFVTQGGTRFEPDHSAKKCGKHRGNANDMLELINADVSFDLMWAIGDALQQKITPCSNDPAGKLMKELRKQFKDDTNLVTTATENGISYKHEIRVDPDAVAANLVVVCWTENRLQHAKIPKGMTVSLVAEYSPAEACGTSANKIKSASLTAALQLDFAQIKQGIRYETFYNVAFRAETAAQPCSAEFIVKFLQKMKTMTLAKLDKIAPLADYSGVVAATGTKADQSG